MSKNLIYTTAINHNTSQFKNTDYSEYCLNSWKAWSSKRDIDFLVIDEHDDRYKLIAPVFVSNKLRNIIST